MDFGDICALAAGLVIGLVFGWRWARRVERERRGERLKLPFE